jgi:excisionase family DNA binding protein
MATKKKSSQNSLFAKSKNEQKTSNSNLEDQKVLAELHKRAQEQEKSFKKAFKIFQPYDLTEIETIAKKVIKRTKNFTIEDKLSEYTIAFDKINKILVNDAKLYSQLNKVGMVDSNYFEILGEANNWKEQLEEKVAKFRVEVVKQAKLNIEKGLLPNTHKNMTVEEVAQYLKRKNRTIYGWAEKGQIPCYKPSGNQWIFIQSEIDDWIKAGKPKTKIASNKKTEMPEYIFKVPPELFTNVFVNNGYLTEPNAIKMAERFNTLPKGKDDSKIEWEEKMKSLLTFILVLEYLDLLETDESNRKGPESLFGREKLVMLAPLMNNFDVKKGGVTETTVSRAKTGIMDALNNVELHVRKLSSGKELSFKEMFKVFYANENRITLDNKLKKGIDWNMCKIVFDNLSK